jgi:hypothetical protein
MNLTKMYECVKLKDSSVGVEFAELIPLLKERKIISSNGFVIDIGYENKLDFSGHLTYKIHMEKIWNERQNLFFKTPKLALTWYDELTLALCELSEKESWEWNYRCERHKEYWAYSTINGWYMAQEMLNKTDEKVYENYWYFPCTVFKKEQLIRDSVCDMSLIERKAYKFGKCENDWGYGKSCNNYTYEIFYRRRHNDWYYSASENTNDMWFGTEETAEKFYKLANEYQWDHFGRAQVEDDLW